MRVETMVRVCVLLLGAITPLVASAERNVRFEGDFESGKVQHVESRVDGFRIRTLPESQHGSTTAIVSDGGADAKSQIDTRVVSDEMLKRSVDQYEIVRPRRGRYFLRSALHRTKDYAALQDGRNKPRSAINIAGEGNRVNFDEEGYLGFSLYLPENWQHETGVKGVRGATQLLQVQSEGASWTLLTLQVYVPPGESVAHWFMTHHFSDSSTKKGNLTKYDLGSVEDDVGKWTDFVLRYRFNPFSAETNASSIEGGKQQVYPGNRGILQLWKSRGPANSTGDRRMCLTAVNLVDKPVGLVPHASKKIGWHFRVYKYGWHRNRTDVQGPVWVGFDEIREGRVLEDGTAYHDVHPSGLACTDQCPVTARHRGAASTAGKPITAYCDG